MTITYRTAKHRYFEPLTGVTRVSLENMKRWLPNLGECYRVVGRRTRTKDGTWHAAVYVYGTEGVARFTGFSWGYCGEGCHGTAELLRACGFGDVDVSRLGVWDRVGFELIRPTESELANV